MGKGLYTGWRTSIAVVLIAALLSSCAGWWFGGGSAGEASGTGASKSQVSPRFYDFADIPVPQELSLVPKMSHVFQSGPLKAGLLVLKGRVDPSSVVNFFTVAMNRENWKLKGSSRYRKPILIFEKPEKTCVISVYEKRWHTFVEIYVVPTSGTL
jgi:hypothetical protein